MSDDLPINATKGELEELNGLLVRKLIDKIKDGTANATDLSTAMHLVKTNQVKPSDPTVPVYTSPVAHTIRPEDFPIQFSDDDEAPAFMR